MSGILKNRQEKMKLKFKLKGEWKRLNPIDEYSKRKVKALKFKREEFLKWLGPIVYIYWKYVDEKIETFFLNDRDFKVALYIGQSSCGMSRPFGRDHHKRNICINADELEILPCLNPEDALLLEKELILYLRPKENSNQKNPPRMYPR